MNGVGNGACKVLQFAKLTPNASTPTKGSAKAAGYDLFR